MNTPLEILIQVLAAAGPSFVNVVEDIIGIFKSNPELTADQISQIVQQNVIAAQQEDTQTTADAQKEING